ncbi:MAG TPA: hypothetical protein VFO95_00430 [Gemmatimonadales bacterium]|jgi:hypothetical protein|nr:hypothetical protein [Gemmatimonadales bacterium]
MARQDDKRIAALARKNAGKVKKSKSDQTTQFDPTLRIRPDEQDPDARRLFKEMKKREF